MSPRPLFLLALAAYGAAAVAASDYARRCEQVIGVPVPDVDCDDPGASTVSVGRRSEAQCDNPSHGLSGCNAGTRFLRFDDTFERDGKVERVTTFIMCRKTNGDAARGEGGAGIYSDIGIIQFNETKNATCWFSKTADGQMPTKTVVKDGVERKVYPSPTTEEARSEFWGNRQPEANCVSCHQNGPWLRTPFASSVGPENGKGYVREGRTGAYRPGTGNNVPADPKLDQFGPPCSVGLPEWNRPEGSLAPFPVKIDADAFDRKVPRPAGQRRDPAEARAGECTRCHYIGVGPAADGGDNCQKYLPEIRTGANANRLAAHRFWMPPDAGELTPAEFQARYGRAIAALEWCCSQRADPDWRRICANRFSTTRMPEARLLDQLAGPRGACALCADCVPPARSGRRGPRGPRGTTGAPGGTHF